MKTTTKKPQSSNSIESPEQLPNDEKPEVTGQSTPGPPPLEISWENSDLPRRPRTLGTRLDEMAISYEWDMPTYLFANVAHARRAIKENEGMNEESKEQLIKTQWPDVYEELCLYERRRLLAEAECGQWKYEIPAAWSRARWEALNEAAEKLEQQLEDVALRSYVVDPDPLLEPKPTLGLDTFLPRIPSGPGFRVR